ncbi:helix-turn-helix transcriptional regulator [Enterococcus sp. BWB1-3]|uniref:helix-turn-helix domain-containing protein n=1 Tax=unclassified Enterococcus TaxID=2608891 RepID=UPI001920DD7C|nr:MULTISPECIES: helix-turn-helix transcriptional regulator [unclassified Enterococcus]MBL1229499.1 helix-turn-helix transcriptional regulator [Enterococcus sp. BWB1-3]MCB5950810.1 helix-turn-helix domain-containing protein [Enterococcus sp. BWT-B8]MCB5955251.1 helix-turn-helix domain-containing protein [Enterococcus sp. CWB-B31]
MEIGETLRFIRKKKKFTQQEISKSYLDRTAYSRIEGDERPVRMNDLSGILDGLSVNVHEFFSYIMFDYDQQSFRELLHNCLDQSNNHHDKEKLISYFKRLNNKTNKNLREFSNYLAIKHCFQNLWNEIPPINKNDVEIAYRNVADKDYYFQYDYAIIMNIIPYFSTERADSIIKQVIPIKDEAKRDSTTKNFAYSILINLINLRIHDNNLSSAKDYLELAKKQPSLFRNYSHRLDLNYLDSLIEFLSNGDPSAYTKLLTFVNMTRDIGDYEKAETMKAELKTLTQKKFDEKYKEKRTHLPINLIKEG